VECKIKIEGERHAKEQDISGKKGKGLHQNWGHWVGVETEGGV